MLVLTLGYFLFLRNQKLLLFTRFYLLGSLLLCLLHPFLSRIVYLLPSNIATVNNGLPFTQAEKYLPEFIISPQQAGSMPDEYAVLLWLYLAGTAVALFLFLVRLLALSKTLHRLSFQPTSDHFLLAHTAGNEPTFSFFRFLAINTTQLTADEYSLVLQHEKTHARQQHSADVLLIALAQILLWFHPAIYLLNKALRQTHEHLADAAVTQTSSAEATYIKLMAKQALAAAGLTFTSNFFQSFTINRIRMIKKHTPTSWHWRIATCLLLTASLSTFVACEKQGDSLSQQRLDSPPPAPTEAQDTPAVTATHDATGIDKQLVPLPPFTIQEVDAEPINGWPTFYQDLINNINYSEEAVRNKIEGTTFISLVIDEQGNVASADIIKDRALGYGLDEEVVRVLKSTKWIPAKRDGKNAIQIMNLPVKFKLGNTLEQ